MKFPKSCIRVLLKAPRLFERQYFCGCGDNVKQGIDVRSITHRCQTGQSLVTVWRLELVIGSLLRTTPRPTRLPSHLNLTTMVLSSYNYACLMSTFHTHPRIKLDERQPTHLTSAANG
jgi:hypothetical protein